MGSDTSKPTRRQTSFDKSNIIKKGSVQRIITSSDSISIGMNNQKQIIILNEYQRMLNNIGWRNVEEIPDSLNKIQQKHKELYHIICEINKKNTLYNINVTRIRNRQSFIDQYWDIYNKHKTYIDKHLPPIQNTEFIHSHSRSSYSSSNVSMSNNSYSEHLSEQKYHNDHKQCECLIQ